MAKQPQIKLLGEVLHPNALKHLHQKAKETQQKNKQRRQASIQKVINKL